MLAPLVPSPLDYVGRRRFAFYPAISSLEANEWLLGLSERSEVQILNARTGAEIWLSRQFIGAVTETPDGLVVGLTQPLHLRGGSLAPRTRRVIPMPAAASPKAKVERHARRNNVVEIRLESSAKSPLNRLLLGVCTGAVVLALLAALITANIRF